VLQSTRVFFAVRFAHVALQKGITRDRPEARRQSWSVAPRPQSTSWRVTG
jgi:hypothetical protein